MRGNYIFKRGINVIVIVVFILKVMVIKVFVYLYVLFVGILYELKVLYLNVCEDYNIECLLKFDVEYIMIGKIEVMKNLFCLLFIV